MKKKLSSRQEKRSYRKDVPTRDQVVHKFQELAHSITGEDVALNIEDEVTDGYGLYSMEVLLTGADGDLVKVEYARTVVFDSGVVRPSKIHQTLYCGDVPCGAGAQYDFVGGQWQEKP
jgi:hypothetical protein